MDIIPKRKGKIKIAQANILVEANYYLTAKEADLVYAMISLIRPEDNELKPYTVRIPDVAQYIGIDKKMLIGR